MADSFSAVIAATTLLLLPPLLSHSGIAPHSKLSSVSETVKTRVGDAGNGVGDLPLHLQVRGGFISPISTLDTLDVGWNKISELVL